MENLEKFGDKLLTYLQSTEIFVKEQAPDFINQFIAYETWKAQWMYKITAVVLGVVVLLQAVNIAGSVCNREWRKDAAGWATVIFGVFGIFALSWFIDCAADLKKLELAPKVYMVEAAKRLLK